jgi:large subunit ribosomal protein LP2
MKYFAAYALLVLGGKTDPSAADLEKLLKEAGVKSDADRAAVIAKGLNGKSLHELISE